MKRIVILFIFSCIGASIYAQEDTSLIKQFGLEANLVSPGVGASYELPLSKRFLSDFTAGLATPLLKGWGSVAIDDSRFKPYTRISVKYYYNRDKRARKGKEINNNRGNFIGIQNKLMYGDITTETTFALNEIYWGVQTEIALFYSSPSGRFSASRPAPLSPKQTHSLARCGAPRTSEAILAPLPRRLTSPFPSSARDRHT